MKSSRGLNDKKHTWIYLRSHWVPELDPFCPSPPLMGSYNLSVTGDPIPMASTAKKKAKGYSHP